MRQPWDFFFLLWHSLVWIYSSAKPRRLLGLAFISAGRNKAHSRRCQGPQKHEAHLPYRKSIGERAHSFRAALRITHPDWACRRKHPSVPKDGGCDLAAVACLR